MRLTVLNDDPWRRINQNTERYKVYLDGEVVKHVFTADDEMGEVLCAVFDKHGFVIIENGEVKTQTLYGQVIIKPS